MNEKIGFPLREIYETEVKFINKLKVLVSTLKLLSQQNNEQKLIEDNLTRLLPAIERLAQFHATEG